MKQSKEILEKEKATKDILSLLLDDSVSALPKREAEVLREILVKDKTIEETAKEFHLTTFRVKQIFPNALRFLFSRMNNFKEKMEQQNELQKELEILRGKLSHYEQLKEKEKRIKDLPVKMQKNLSMNIADCNFSSRVKNTLHFAGAMKVSDLVRFTKKDFLKLRNTGIKSVLEVETFFNSNDLNWRMKF